MEVIRFPGLPPIVNTHLIRHGYKKCYYAYYTCKPTDVLTRVVNHATVHVLGDGSLIGMTDFDERTEVFFPALQSEFIEGKYVISERSSTRPMQGNYLYIAMPIVDDSPDGLAKAQEKVQTCAAFISLLHGEMVATERHFSAVCDLVADIVTANAGGFHMRQTIAEEGINQDLAKILDETPSCRFVDKPNVLALVRRAHHEQDSCLKFLFMWLALEATLGNGKSRKAFAIETMKSDYLDSVINNLRQKRDALMHDGKIAGLTQKEYLQIKCIIIMGLSQSLVLRVRLLEYLVGKLHGL